MINVVEVPALIDDREEIITRTAGILKRGGQIIFPTEHSYAIAVDAFNVGAVADLNALRGANPGTALPVMVGSPRTLSGIARDISPVTEELISSCWPGLLTLIVAPSPGLAWDLGDGGALGQVAVRMPLHPLAIEILRATGPLAVTTASLAGAPIPREVDALGQEVSESAEMILNLGTLAPGPLSTIIDVTVDPPRLIREGAYTIDELKVIAPNLVLD